MIDFIKINVQIDCNKWLDNPLLNFKAELDLKTAEIKEKFVAIAYGLKFVIKIYKNKTSKCTVYGSLHYFFNGGLHNTNDFTYEDVINIFKVLESNYDIPKESQVVNFEYGLNIELPTYLTVKQYLNGIIAHRTINNSLSPFTIAPSRLLSLGKVVYRTNYHIKAYDKGLQSKLDSKYLLRTEIKVMHKRYLEQTGLKDKDKPFTISKLTDLETFKKLSELLIGEYKRMLYIDVKPMQCRQLTQKQQLRLLAFSTPQYWEKQTEKTRTRKIISFKNILSKVSDNSIQNEVIDILSNKLKSLMNNHTYEMTALKKVLKTTSNVVGAKLDKGLNINNNNKRVCLICGNDISSKKGTAKFCCKKCRDKKAYNNRKEKRHNIIKHETIILNSIKDKINYLNTSSFYYMNKGKQRRIKVNVNSLNSGTMPYKKRRKVVSLDIIINDIKYNLTKNRAKELLKIIIYNNENMKHETSIKTSNQYFKK